MNLDLLRSFFAIVDQGSLNKAAERLHVSQSTLSRQMHALEHEIGGRIFERSASGVALTATGHALHDSMRPLLGRFETALGEARRLARGQRSDLRIGYLMSAAAEYLHPALAALRRTHPEVKVKLLDLSPGEQIGALRRGEIDLALLGNAGAFLSREFFVRRLALLPVFVAVADTHPLAGRRTLALADLRGELFVGADERDMPGHNQWIVQLCRRARFRPRFVLDAESLTHALATVVTEGAVLLQPDYARSMKVPGIVFRPLQDSAVKWELLLAWQRGKVADPVRAILAALPTQRGAAG
ncbi:LysR family transcriptional regulator [Opitutus terrae]|uniref:Transcriptional regulator, LysR family n=1 Tax=Opitutus terrae (strain DSM 11246 / JCM 15787 / PB90-1) TaxID=452637 RepID=B1ZPR1_OPITP|nr:LysR family transcriptional regulator [Opitutus terrae]ACB75514.1 transcriptional regulator, LysR family [Opitutus terrae PB90-1]